VKCYKIISYLRVRCSHNEKVLVNLELNRGFELVSETQLSETISCHSCFRSLELLIFFRKLRLRRINTEVISLQVNCVQIYTKMNSCYTKYLMALHFL